MIGYVTLGASDLKRAAEFYDALLAELGAKRMFEDDRFIAWSRGKGAALSVCKPHDGAAATVGNGVMVALAVKTRDAVDALHAKALELGARDEGEPGPRGGEGSGFYGAYFRDLDGNKLNVHCFGA